jgi:AGCS family alanine or glycine:cation symporter
VEQTSDVMTRAGAALARAVFTASDLIFGPWTIALLFGAGIFLTLRFRLVQLRHWREVLASVRRAPSASEGALSPFQAFTTALAASIGTGNIAGVATAIVSGGPGALFWIWCYGFVAMAIKFAEAVLGVRYRQLGGGHLSAGPMHYLRDGLGMPRLGWLYALVAGVAAFTTTPFTQPNSIAVVLESQFGVRPLATGIVVAVLAWLVVIGGVKWIGRAAEMLAPLKVGLYLLGGLVVIVMYAAEIPGVLRLIVTEAFSLRAAAGTSTEPRSANPASTTASTGPRPRVIPKARWQKSLLRRRARVTRANPARTAPRAAWRRPSCGKRRSSDA